MPKAGKDGNCIEQSKVLTDTISWRLWSALGLVIAFTFALLLGQVTVLSRMPHVGEMPKPMQDTQTINAATDHALLKQLPSHSLDLLMVNLLSLPSPCSL